MIKFNKDFDKKEFFGELGMIIALLAFAVFLMYELGKADEYRKSAEVLCYYEDTAVEFMTEDGNTWLVNVPSTEQYHVGDEVTLTFKNIGDDDNIYNDEVVEVK